MYFVLKTMSFLVSLLPIKFIYAISGGITKIVFFFWRAKRKNVYENYKQILTAKFGEVPSEKLLKHIMTKNFENYGKFNVEFLILNKLATKGLINMEIEGKEHIEKALSFGKGLVMGVLHFGNWDAAGVIVANSFQPNWAVADDLGGGYSNYVQNTRHKYGINIVLPNKNLKNIYTSLEQNGVLNVLVDRPMSPADKKAVEVTFFGKKTLVASAAARIALKSGAKTMLGVAIRKNDKFYGIGSPVLEYELTGDQTADLQRVTQAFLTKAAKEVSN